MPITVLASPFACAAASVSVVGSVNASMRERTIATSRQSTAAGMQELSKGTGLNVSLCLVGDNHQREMPIGQIRRRYTAESSFRELLSNSGRVLYHVNDAPIVVGDHNCQQQEGEKVNNVQSRLQLLADRREIDEEAIEAATREGIRQVIAVRAHDSQPPKTGPGGRSVRASMEEVIVTAHKRAERLQDVPISITALTADDINRRGLVSAEDYLRGMPGVSCVESAVGGGIIIRGVETNTSNPAVNGRAVATYFDETSVTGSAGGLKRREVSRYRTSRSAAEAAGHCIRQFRIGRRFTHHSRSAAAGSL